MHSRKVIEHTVLFELKANVGDMVRKNMVKELANLKEDCSKWVVAESAGTLSPTKAIPCWPPALSGMVSLH